MSRRFEAGFRQSRSGLLLPEHLAGEGAVAPRTLHRPDLQELYELARMSNAQMMADNAQFFNDLREPHIVSDLASVTLSTTDKALYTPSAFPPLGPQYFARPGKKVKIRLFGKITTAATPGNGTFALYYGDGTDANGVLLVSSAAMTLIASQTNLSWEAEFYVRCITTGATGTLEVTGHWEMNVAVVAAQNGLIPASAAAPSGSCDLTVAKILSVQFKRSGSTAETMVVQDLEVIPLN